MNAQQQIDREEVDGLIVVLTSILLEYQQRRGMRRQTALETMEAVCEMTAFWRNKCTPENMRSLFDETLTRHYQNRQLPDQSAESSEKPH